MGRLRFVAILAALVVLAGPVAAYACPNCKTMLEDPGQMGTSGSMAGGVSGNMAAGYYYSILFMLGTMFSLAGLVVFAIVRQARRESNTWSDQPLG
jgi:hypothetical protein